MLNIFKKIGEKINNYNEESARRLEEEKAGLAKDLEAHQKALDDLRNVDELIVEDRKKKEDRLAKLRGEIDDMKEGQ